MNVLLAYPGNIQALVLIYGCLVYSQISIGVRGMAVCVPVWVAQPSIVLKICMFDRLYQDNIVVQSRRVRQLS